MTESTNCSKRQRWADVTTSPPGTDAVQDDAETGTWSCPGDPFEDNCGYHTDPAETPTTFNPAEQILADTDRSFVGAHLDELVLAGESLSSRERIDLRDADIGTLAIHNTPLTRPLDLRGADIDVFRLHTTAEAAILLDESRIGELDWRVDAPLVSAQDATINQADCQHCQFERAWFQRAKFQPQKADFRFTEFGYVEFNHVEFTYGDFWYCDFESPDFRDAEFDRCRFRSSRFNASHFQNAEFGYANFKRAKFYSTRFKGTHFDNAVFRQDADFSNAVVEGGDFTNVTAPKLAFTDAQLERVEFNGSNITIFDCRRATLTDANLERLDTVELSAESAELTAVGMSNVSIGQLHATNTRLDNVTIEGGAVAEPVFDDATVTTLSITGTVLAGYVSAAGMNAAELTFAPAVDTGTPLFIDLQDSQIDSGKLQFGAPGAVVYNLAHGCIGSVVADAPSCAPLRHMRLLRTDFDGFDFTAGRDIDLRGADYEIHTLYPGAATSAGRAKANTRVATDHIKTEENWTSISSKKGPRELADSWPVSDDASSLTELRPEDDSTTATTDPVDVEKTYLKAKKGASDRGNATAAGRFFRREMLARRRYHRRQMSTGGFSRRLRAASDWFQNTTMGVTTGYGERPSYVIIWSLGIIAAGSVVYATALNSSVPNPSFGLTEYVLFSAQSFVSFVVGPPLQPPSDIWLRAVATIQGLLGAFFVALFVFALTRRVHR